MVRSLFRKAAPIGLLLASAGALAHSGAAMALTGPDAAGLLQGLWHPFTGMDHLLALLAVGAWSAMSGHRSWVYPLVFINALLWGALLGMSGWVPAALEPLLALSLVVLGLLVAFRRAPAPAGAVWLLSGLGLLHGVAHGVEFGVRASLALPLGMVLASLLLLGLGVVLGTAAQRVRPMWHRVAGVGVALVGGALCAQLV